MKTFNGIVFAMLLLVVSIVNCKSDKEIGMLSGKDREKFIDENCGISVEYTWEDASANPVTIAAVKDVIVSEIDGADLSDKVEEMKTEIEKYLDEGTPPESGLEEKLKEKLKDVVCFGARIMTMIVQSGISGDGKICEDEEIDMGEPTEIAECILVNIEEAKKRIANMRTKPTVEEASPIGLLIIQDVSRIEHGLDALLELINQSEELVLGELLRSLQRKDLKLLQAVLQRTARDQEDEDKESKDDNGSKQSRPNPKTAIGDYIKSNCDKSTVLVEEWDTEISIEDLLGFLDAADFTGWMGELEKNLNDYLDDPTADLDAQKSLAEKEEVKVICSIMPLFELSTRYMLAPGFGEFVCSTRDPDEDDPKDIATCLQEALTDISTAILEVKDYPDGGAVEDLIVDCFEVYKVLPRIEEALTLLLRVVDTDDEVRTLMQLVRRLRLDDSG